MISSSTIAIGFLTLTAAPLAVLPFEIPVNEIEIYGLRAHTYDDVFEILGVASGDTINKPNERDMEFKLYRSHLFYSVDVVISEYGELTIDVEEK